MTELVGTVVSMVLEATAVDMGLLVSKTTVAWALTTVPVVAVVFGSTVYVTKPSPSGSSSSGGRKPANGSMGVSIVAGSRLVNVQVARPVAGFKVAETRQ